MKTSIFARPGLALGAALVLHQSAAAVSMITNLGSISDVSVLSGSGNANFSWDFVTQKAKMDSASSNIGTAGQLAGAFPGTGLVQPSVGPMITGVGPMITGGGGSNSAGPSPNPTGTSVSTTGPALSSGSPSGSMVQVPNSPGTQGAATTSQGLGGSDSIVALPAVSLITHVASDDEGRPYGDDGMVLIDTLIRPTVVVTAAVNVSEMGGESLLLPFGLAALLAFSARFKKRGSSNTCPRLVTG